MRPLAGSRPAIEVPQLSHRQEHRPPGEPGHGLRDQLRARGPRRADVEVLHRKMRVVGVAEPDSPAQREPQQAGSTLRFRVFLANASQINRNALRMRAALLENARFRYHTSLELWKQYDFRAKCCWSRAGPACFSVTRSFISTLSTISRVFKIDFPTRSSGLFSVTRSSIFPRFPGWLFELSQRVGRLSMLKERREEKKKYVRQGPRKQESRSPRNFNTLSGCAHVMFVLCAAAHIVATIA